MFESKVDDVQEFCDNNLAYLTDEGFVIDVEPHGKNRGMIGINIKIPKEHPGTNANGGMLGGKPFNWSDIKYDVIPFVQLLNKKFRIESISYYIPFDRYISLYNS